MPFQWSYWPLCIGSQCVGPVPICSGLDLSHVPKRIEKTLTFEICQEIVIVACLEEMPAQQCGMFWVLMLVQFSWSVCETLLLCSLPFSSAFQLGPHVLFVLDKVLKITHLKQNWKLLSWVKTFSS